MATTSETREWMSPPSNLRHDINWQAQGWEKPWKFVTEWATTHSPGTAKSIAEAEAKLAEAHKTAHPSSKPVHDAQSWINRVYFLSEESYFKSFKERK